MKSRKIYLFVLSVFFSDFCAIYFHYIGEETKLSLPNVGKPSLTETLQIDYRVQEQYHIR